MFRVEKLPHQLLTKGFSLHVFITPFHSMDEVGYSGS